MKKLVIAGGLLAVGALCLQDISSGHGGTYRGPGDTVPPGGGGTTGGGPSTPGTGGPTTPGPSGPTTPGPAAPGTPGGAPSGPRGPATQGGGADTGPDLTLWQYWWGFNKEPYINLKSHIHTGTAVTGSDDFFLGQGEHPQGRDNLRPSDDSVRTKVVPALINSLHSERSNDIVTGCLIALAKIGDANSEDGKSQMAVEIKAFLGDSNQEIAETAAVALGILANEAKENIDILGYLLNNDTSKLRSEMSVSLNGSVPDRSRAFAAYGLGLIGHKAKDENRATIVALLTKMLDGESRTMGTRDVAVSCLTSLGLVAMPIDQASATSVDLKKGFPHPSEVKTRQDQLLWLLSFYEEPKINYLVRAHVPQAVGKLLIDTPSDYWLRNVVAERFLSDIAKLSKEKDEVKQSCIIALGEIGDCDGDEIDGKIRAGLMAVKEDLSDQMSKNFALIALAQCAGRPGSGKGNPLEGFDDKKASPRAYLMTELGKAKVNKAWVAIALGVMERSLSDNKYPANSDVKAALRLGLKEAKAPLDVGAFSIALGIAKDADSKDILRDKFNSVSEDEARGYAAVGLGLIEDLTAIETIQEVIRKSKYKPDLLKSAAIGLGLLGDKKICDDLITMLNEATGLSSQSAISSALGFIGDARSIEPLITMLNDKQKTDRARGFAAVALGIVADKEDLPWNTKISLNINYRANTPTLTSPVEGTGILDIL
jgi:HEAT repeat protein